MKHELKLERVEVLITGNFLKMYTEFMEVINGVGITESF